jgi:methanethiol S-methyltransferase
MGSPDSSSASRIAASETGIALRHDGRSKAFARLLILLSLGVGGGSLLLFAYFLYFGTPLAIRIARSDTSRLAWDSLLCLVFFLQHSGMIRRGAKKRIAKRVQATCHPALYSIASGVALIALVLLWQPTDAFLFGLHGPARWLSGSLALLAIAGFTWGVRSLGGFDPFGTLPLTAALRGTPVPSLPFVVQGPYRYVRHPLYLFMLMLIWSAPRLSTDQLLFDVLWTAWIVVGTRLEERDLLADFGHTYRQYQRSVPMLIPSPRHLMRAARQALAQAGGRARPSWGDR